MIIPSAAAKNLSQNLKAYSFGSALIGTLSCLLGVLLYRFTGFPVGPLIILTSAFFFLISFFFKKS
jgi:ABC-type Mn2+/Zn2+ transport system permease subunit